MKNNIVGIISQLLFSAVFLLDCIFFIVTDNSSKAFFFGCLFVAHVILALVNLKKEKRTKASSVAGDVVLCLLVVAAAVLPLVGTAFKEYPVIVAVNIAVIGIATVLNVVESAMLRKNGNRID